MNVPTFDEEERLWRKGYNLVVGVDEVGRGAFAGPVVAAAVVFRTHDSDIAKANINDSKLLRPRQRERLTREIKEKCLAFAIAEIGVSTINKFGVGRATQMAFRKVITKLLHVYMAKIATRNNHAAMQLFNHIFVLVDGFHVRYLRGVGLENQRVIIKGDQKSISIAAASIVAKVHRDRLMRRFTSKYKHYGFGRNKGYGTKMHQEAIKKYGLSPIHRKSFNLRSFFST